MAVIDIAAAEAQWTKLCAEGVELSDYTHRGVRDLADCLLEGRVISLVPIIGGGRELRHDHPVDYRGSLRAWALHGVEIPRLPRRPGKMIRVRADMEAE